MTDIALMPVMPLIARFVWFASAPAKSSVEIWLAGMSESWMRNCVHWSSRPDYVRFSHPVV
jgi:hypothetical protein